MDLQGGEYSLTSAVTSVNTTGVAGVASGGRGLDPVSPAPQRRGGGDLRWWL